MESKPLPDYSKTDAYQVNLTFQAAIQDKAFLFFMKEVQESRAEKLNVFDLLTLDKIRKGINDSLDPNIIEKLRKEQLITVNEGTTYSLADKYKQFIPRKESIKGVTSQQLQKVNECFKTHDSISKSTLMETFNGVLTEKQVRNLISRMEQSGIIKRIGVGKATKYIKDWDKFKKYI